MHAKGNVNYTAGITLCQQEKQIVAFYNDKTWKARLFSWKLVHKTESEFSLDSVWIQATILVLEFANQQHFSSSKNGKISP